MTQYRAHIEGNTTCYDGSLPVVLNAVNQYFVDNGGHASIVHLWEKRGKTVRSWRIVAEWSQCGIAIVEA